jgi:prepilin-type N-terminal cleavage/methylation domain-containing protein
MMNLFLWLSRKTDVEQLQFWGPHGRRIAVQAASGGFTLIELLVVIAIIGILASAVLVAINPAQRIAEARNSQRQSDLGDIKTALEQYATAHNGLYPSGSALCEDCTYSAYRAVGKDNWIPGLVSEGYIKHLPTDPNEMQGDVCKPSPSASYAAYVYFSSADHKNYKVLVQCTMPKSVVNNGTSAPPGGNAAYCPQRASGNYDISAMVEAPTSSSKLKAFVDPPRANVAYSVYSPGWACW